MNKKPWNHLILMMLLNVSFTACGGDSGGGGHASDGGEEKISPTAEFCRKEVTVTSSTMPKRTGKKKIAKMVESCAEYTGSTEPSQDGIPNADLNAHLQTQWKEICDGNAMCVGDVPLGTLELSISDVMLDYKSLIGKQVSVRGFFFALTDELNYLYEEQGSTNYINIDKKKLIREDRKFLLKQCDKGCNTGFFGVITNDPLLGPKMIAEEIVK
jgi:hypothetical protein